MNPKKHAIELINKFFPDLKSITEMGFSHGRKEYAKKCAIILCNEIIKNNKNVISTLSYSPDLICSTQYYKKVIEKIKEL